MFPLKNSRKLQDLEKYLLSTKYTFIRFYKFIARMFPFSY